MTHQGFLVYVQTKHDRLGTFEIPSDLCSSNSIESSAPKGRRRSGLKGFELLMRSFGASGKQHDNIARRVFRLA